MTNKQIFRNNSLWTKKELRELNSINLFEYPVDILKQTSVLSSSLTRTCFYKQVNNVRTNVSLEIRRKFYGV